MVRLKGACGLVGDSCSVSHAPFCIRSGMTTNQHPQTFILNGAAIANFVRLQRRIWHWKQATITSQASISLRTV
jgi:hypothetical protein